MALFFYIAMALVAACHAQVSYQAPTAVAAAPASRSASCPFKEGYYKTDASCDAYTECKNYEAVDKLCPDGLHYNPSAVYPTHPCSYPMDVNCVGRGSARHAQVSYQAPTAVAAAPASRSASCPFKEGYYKTDASCDAYTECKNYEAVDKLCPDGLHYNPSAVYPTHPCSYPMDVNCVGRGSARHAQVSYQAPTAVAAAPASRSASCPFKEGYYKTDASCDAYTECKNYEAVDKLCPDGLHYNPSAVYPTHPCSYPMDVNCVGRGSARHAQVSYQAPTAVAAAPASRSASCPIKEGYYKTDASCDAYIECENYVAVDKLCPDGLHYNPSAVYPTYPCSYPMDVNCVGRGSAQAPQPTADCPHQYGYFRSPLAQNNCGEYRVCVAGIAFEMICPAGLAFNADKGVCDWPDKVPDCDGSNYLGFTCPAVATDANGQPLANVFNNYKYEGNCYYFWNCEVGEPRLLSCDEGLAFDPVSARCVDACLVQCG